ncbi:Major Facilitator Superfamily transporter [Pseudarthrobacter phenanthrenivorans Sphe3]|uniref:Major Facilitator Superfamily transporter n=1 Tax=Pseudarthrobacter phenanthrenivorans (strain DSM 18606 / JCM 16027 / LMG 23796 / Sphe3) TaxID=930171 RepID=F0M5W9_PSEPM|nr:MFS transporter [Pseudarthrobacter phenanthrenivorans]ADX73564.1 Major Facilitator Superfamily transporter [Pseudarthrobacter phenanthrenivorans Sphe3]
MNSPTQQAGTPASRPAEQPVPSGPASSGRFARLPLLAGRSFIPLGLFARLPLAMLALGTLTLVTSVSGSYALGGTAAGAVGIGSAVGAPVLGALADRRGQRPILLLAALFNTLAVVALIVAAQAMAGHGGIPAMVLAASFLSGASCPQVGPLARVRWMALASQGAPAERRRDLDTALSYESTADEVTFVLGPALVGILASLLAPWLPLALAAAMTILLVPAFAVHPTHRAVQMHRAVKLPGAMSGGNPKADAITTEGGSRRREMLPAAVALPVLAMVCMGTFFGSTQAALSPFSAGFAGSETAGLLYAVMGLSSAVAALSVAYWPARFSLSWRWIVCAGLMSALALLLLLPSSMPAMVAVLLALGLPVGPVMVTVFAAGGTVAPAGRLGTVMTALASGIVAGTAVGSFLGGQLAEMHGYQAAFLVPVCAAAALALLGAGAAVVLRRRL